VYGAAIAGWNTARVARGYVVPVTSPSAAGSGGSLFTVVLFSGTHAAGSSRALASVLGQTVGQPAVIDIGDGRDVESAAVLEALGASLARHLAFLDTDDLWLPHRLDLALAGLARAPIAWCASRRTDELPGGPRATVPRSASAIAVDRSVLAADGAPLDDVDALRAFFVGTQAVWDRWVRTHEVAAVDEVGVLTGYR
jgi:hypothetical protein